MERKCIEMNQESFAQAITGLKELAKAYENVLAMADIEEELKELKLTKEQLHAVCEYLLENKIEIADYKKEETKEKTEVEENEEDSKFLKMYMEEIKEFQDIDKERLEEIFQKAVEGKKEEREELISGYLNRIVDFAKLYRGQGVFLEDLIQEGNIGLLNALYSAQEQPKIGDVESYLAEQICESMEASIYELETENQAEEYIVKQIEEVDRYISQFEKEYNRKPTAQELAERMQKDIEEVKDIMKYLK